MKGRLPGAKGATRIGKRDGSLPQERFRKDAAKLFRRLVMQSNFPCVGAKSAFNTSCVSFHAYEELASDDSTKSLARDLGRFTRTVAADQRGVYATMIAVFRGPLGLSEREFEKLLWLQLSKLHLSDAPNEWDPRVSSDPSAPDFSFSFARQAYYLVGMHADSSRHARRFRWPTLVFNPHEQFERLRAEGNWGRMKQAIRARDLQLQGSINPMLSDFGELSEARQYSGRAVEEDWHPPFAPRKCPFAH